MQKIVPYSRMASCGVSRFSLSSFSISNFIICAIFLCIFMYFMYFCTKMTLFDRCVFRGFSLWDRSYNIIIHYIITHGFSFVGDVCVFSGFVLSVCRKHYLHQIFYSFCCMKGIIYREYIH